MSISNWQEESRGLLLKPYTIDEMMEADLDAVVEIEEISGLNRWGYDAYRRELLTNPNSVMLVARNLYPDEHKLLGFFAGWTVEDELHVNNIASHPSYRRMGIGQALLATGIDRGRLRGVHYVLLEVRASNEVAQSLYRKMGFSYIGRRRDYYRFPTEDAFVMRLEVF
ncbi:MAG TPA: ribosomal protein S18-alanine N-acetyltransferase [Blastocatellia bacterium]|nr:ribosomal protein S18-alanine N-acetyltransferase [Blastocatellia bacterium]